MGGRAPSRGRRLPLSATRPDGSGFSRSVAGTPSRGTGSARSWMAVGPLAGGDRVDPCRGRSWAAARRVAAGGSLFRPQDQTALAFHAASPALLAEGLDPPGRGRQSVPSRAAIELTPVADDH